MARTVVGLAVGGWQLAVSGLRLILGVARRKTDGTYGTRATDAFNTAQSGANR